MFETKAWAIETDMFGHDLHLAEIHYFQYGETDEAIQTALFKTRGEAREAAKRFILCKATVVRVEVSISIVRKPCTES